MKKTLFAAAIIFSVYLAPVQAQTKEDSLAIRAAAENYIFGFYEGNAD
ncbi:MAG: hypothetical protein WC061_10950 [Melioribacteraceae bacterium]